MTSTDPSTTAPADDRDMVAPGYDPRAALADCLESWGSGSWQDSNAVANLDEVMAHVERLLAPAPVSPVDEHLTAVCAEAHLNSMVEVFAFVLDREQVSDEQVLALTADDVTGLHDAYVAPAVDRIEDALLDRS